MSVKRDESNQVVPDEVIAHVADLDPNNGLRDHFFPAAARVLMQAVTTSRFEARSFDYFGSRHIPRIESYMKILAYTICAGVCIGLAKGSVSWAISSLRSERLNEMSIQADQTGGIAYPMGVMIIWMGVSALLTSIIIVKFSPSAGGGGIADMKAYLNGNVLVGFLSLRTLLGRLLTIPIVTSSGAMLGSKGPLSHVGMIIGYLVPRSLCRGRLTEGELFDFAAVGSGIGMAAALNSPLAGTLFAIEDSTSFWHPELLSRTLLGSVVAVICSLYTSAGFQCDPTSLYCVSLQNEFAFTSSSLSTVSYQPWELLLFILVGGACGGISVYIQRVLLFVNRIRSRGINKSPMARIADTCLVFSATAVLYCLCTLGSRCYDSENLPLQNLTISAALCPSGTYNPVALILLESPSFAIRTLFSADALCCDSAFDQGNLWLSVSALAVAFIATNSVAVPAGLFVPLVFFGSVLGRIFGNAVSVISGVSSVSPGVYALVGSAGFLAGMNRMTVWMAVVLIETTGALTLSIPIILSVFAAKWVADSLQPRSLFESIVIAKRLKFLPACDRRQVVKRTRSRVVKDVMTSPVVSLFESDSLDAVSSIINKFPFESFPIVTARGELVGVASRSEIEKKLKQAQNLQSCNLDKTVAIEFGRDNLTIVSVSPESLLEHSYMLFLSLGLAILVVTDTSNHVQGVLTRTNLFNSLS